MLVAYCPRTGTKTTLAALRAANWRLLVSATGRLRTEGFRYALDNGAWTAYTQQKPFDVARFNLAVTLLGTNAEFVVVPDIVASQQSLAFSLQWLPRLHGLRLLLAVQDGMTPADVRPLCRKLFGFAIGGTTQWKEETAKTWGRFASFQGKYLHMLRVNSARRIDIARHAGCHSFDGLSPVAFPKTLPLLDEARRRFELRLE